MYHSTYHFHSKLHHGPVEIVDILPIQKMRVFQFAIPFIPRCFAAPWRRPAPSPPGWHPPAASAPLRCATSTAARAAARGRRRRPPRQLRQLRNRRGKGRNLGWVKIGYPKDWKVKTRHVNTKLN